MEVSKALEVLTEAMKEDPDYAHTWHCNVAMSMYDAFPDHDHDKNHAIANEGASRFMQLCFGIQTSGDMLDGQDLERSE